MTTAISRAGGGVFEAVVAQAALLRSLGHVPVVLGVEDAAQEEDAGRLQDVEVRSVPRVGPASVGWGPRLFGALMAAQLDVLHLHGIWQPTSLAASRWAAATRRGYIISPHGMLDPWILARGRLKKRIARAVYEHASWSRATLLHALTHAEAHDIASATGRTEIAVIPNAVSGMEQPVPVEQSHAPFFLYLSRIHPKKNLDALLDGWTRLRVAGTTQGWRLVIHGWGDGEHVAALRERLAAFADPSVTFPGPVFGDEKAALLRDAAFVVLPSHSEGLPMAILEAWALATPTIMSPACHLDQGFAAGAAMDSGTTGESVAAALQQAIAMTREARAEMGAAARQLSAREFSFTSVARRWNDAYRRAAAA